MSRVVVVLCTERLEKYVLPLAHGGDARCAMAAVCFMIFVSQMEYKII